MRTSCHLNSSSQHTKLNGGLTNLIQVTLKAWTKVKETSYFGRNLINVNRPEEEELTEFQLFELHPVEGREAPALPSGQLPTGSPYQALHSN